MKKAVLSVSIFFVLIIFILSLSSQASAFFGCAPSKFAVISKGDSGLHLNVCGFTPNVKVQETLTKNNLQLMGGEILPVNGAWNMKKVNDKLMAYAGTIPIQNAINALMALVNDPIETKEVQNHAEKIASILETFSLFLAEDKLAEIKYTSGELLISPKGLVEKGEIEISKKKLNGQENVMRVGSIAGTYVIMEKHGRNQEDLKVSGVKINFLNAKERKITWLDDNSSFTKYISDGKQPEDIIAGPKGTFATFVPEDEGKIKGKDIIRNGQKVKNGFFKLYPTTGTMLFEKDTTLLCCDVPSSRLSIAEYCIPAKQKLYPLSLLGTDCSFGLGNIFNIDKESVKGQNIEIINVKLLFKEKIKELISA